MLTKIFYHILGLLVAFCLLFAVLITVTETLLYRVDGYFAKEYQKYAVTERVDMRLSDLLSVTDEMMDYLKGDRENLNVEAVIGGVQREFFNAKEKRHMQDVRELLLQGLALRRGAVFVGVLAAAFLCLKKRQAVLLRMLQWGIAGVLCTMLGLGALISMDFTKYFTYFHLIFFDNMDWYLNPKTDLLINIVPEGFFRDTALRIAGMFLAVSLLFWLMAGALRRRLK